MVLSLISAKKQKSLEVKRIDALMLHFYQITIPNYLWVQYNNQWNLDCGWGQ